MLERGKCGGWGDGEGKGIYTILLLFIHVFFKLKEIFGKPNCSCNPHYIIQAAHKAYRVLYLSSAVFLVMEKSIVLALWHFLEPWGC